jgi:DMSO/TMAO reductase YedYZ molybdopterin-dependent catalytic subunit
MESKVRARAETPIMKPLPPGKFVDYREGEAKPQDTTGDLAYNAEMRWEAMAGKGYLTPIGSFFVRNHAPTPSIDPASWALRVEGPGVGRPLKLTHDDLSDLPQVSVVRAPECAGNGRAFFEEVHGRQAEGTPWRLGAIGVAEWTGVPLRERAGLKASARDVMLESLDAVRMRRPLPVEKALEDDTLLAFGMNRGLLTPDHGFPLRAVVPGWAAVASVKWLGRIHVSETPLSSPWNTDKYVLTGGSSGEGRIPLTSQNFKSALELPWPVRLPAGSHILCGRSWSGHGAISLVEYSVDGGLWRGAPLRGERPRGVGAVELRVGGEAGMAQDQGQGHRRRRQRAAGRGGVE